MVYISGVSLTSSWLLSTISSAVNPSGFATSVCTDSDSVSCAETSSVASVSTSSSLGCSLRVPKRLCCIAFCAPLTEPSKGTPPWVDSCIGISSFAMINYLPFFLLREFCHSPLYSLKHSALLKRLSMNDTKIL